MKKVMKRLNNPPCREQEFIGKFAVHDGCNEGQVEKAGGAAKG